MEKSQDQPSVNTEMAKQPTRRPANFQPQSQDKLSPFITDLLKAIRAQSDEKLAELLDHPSWQYLTFKMYKEELSNFNRSFMMKLHEQVSNKNKLSQYAFLLRPRLYYPEMPKDSKDRLELLSKMDGHINAFIIIEWCVTSQNDSIVDDKNYQILCNSIFGFTKKRVREVDGKLEMAHAKQIPSHFPGIMFLNLKDSQASWYDFDFKVCFCQAESKVFFGFCMRVLNIKEVYAAFTKSIDGMAADFQSQVTSRAIYFPSKWKHNLFEPIGISGLTVKTHWTDLDHDLDQEEAKKLNVKAEPPRDSNGYVIEGSGNRKVLVQYTNGTCKAFVPQKRLLINREPIIIISSDSSQEGCLKKRRKSDESGVKKQYLEMSLTP